MQELTIALIVILILSSIYLLISYPIHNIIYRKTFRYRDYKKLMKYVEKKDYRLINNFCFNIDENTTGHFDHVVFGSKYIYLVTDKYWRMGVYGKPKDQSWIFFKDEKKRMYIDNPLEKNELRKEKLSLVTGIDKSLFVVIVVVNNDCVVDEDVLLNEQNIITREKNLIKRIESFENQNIASINDDQLQNVVYMFDKKSKQI